VARNGAELKLPDSRKMRDSILALEELMKDMPQVDLEVIHRFAPGMYCRELIIPAGVMLTGKIHKTEHFSIMLSGRMLVPDGEGGATEIEGPRIEIAQPGIKRVGMAITEVRWITLHATEETDPALIEEQITTDSFELIEDQS